MRRISRTLAITASVAIFAAACSSGDSGDDATDGDTDGGDATEEPAVRGDEELVIWTDNVKLAAVQAVAEKFAADNGITVGVQALTDTRTSFLTANAAGNGPDVVAGAHDWIGQLVQNGAIDPLQLSPSDLDGYAETAVQATTYDGQLYGLPYGVEAIALYCNTEYAPDTYSSLDDVIAAGQAAVDAGSVEVQLSQPVGNDGDPYHMEPIYTSAGGYLFGQNADGTYNADDLGVGKPGSIEAAKKIGSLGESGSNVLRRSISGDNSQALFNEGNAACMISGPWALNDVRASGIDYTVQPIPGFAGMNPAVPFMGAQAFYVASNGLNKSFAQEFVTNGLNNVEAMTTLYEEANLVPALLAVRDGITDEDTLKFAAAADGGAPMPAIPAMAEVWTPLGQAYSAIVGGSDPETSITQAGQTIAAAIAAS